MKRMEDWGDPLMDDLGSYCQSQEIFFHNAIRPKRVAGRGLGIYAMTRIQKGERLVHVPNSALFTTGSVPEEFASKALRNTIPVHALLAAYFAFGPESDLARLKPWLNTWPQYSEFASSIPLTWPSDLKHPSSTRNEVLSNALPPPITGSYIGDTDESKESRNGSTTLVGHQNRKVTSHIASLKPILSPEIYAELQSSNSAKYYKFLHAWLCVNTRCFSYTAHGKKRPKDPNEAMALCPGMDLFNHAVKPTVVTKYDRSGYFATALREHLPGEEVLFNYGQHVNDVLWTEYGFILDENFDDAIRIDKIVLEGINDKQKENLQAQGYLNEYWLSANGLCYRSEVVAWMNVLRKNDWLAMLGGTYDPEREETASENGKRTADGLRKQARTPEARSRSHRLICAKWADDVEIEASAALESLLSMSKGTILDTFGDGIAALELQQRACGDEKIASGLNELRRTNQQRSRQRHEICVKRWTQIKEMAGAARRAVLQE